MTGMVSAGPETCPPPLFVVHSLVAFSKLLFTPSPCPATSDTVKQYTMSKHCGMIFLDCFASLFNHQLPFGQCVPSVLSLQLVNFMQGHDPMIHIEHDNRCRETAYDGAECAFAVNKGYRKNQNQYNIQDSHAHGEQYAEDFVMQYTLSIVSDPSKLVLGHGVFDSSKNPCYKVHD